MDLDLFTFFNGQRRTWYDRTRQYPAEYVAGGWAALLQAEIVFQRGPLFNASIQTREVRVVLDETAYRLTQAHKQILQLKEEHAAAFAAVRATKKGTNVQVEHHKHQAARTRRLLERMKDVAGLDEYEPEVRLRYLQELISTHQASLRAANPDVTSDESPDALPDGLPR